MIEYIRRGVKYFCVGMIVGIAIRVVVQLDVSDIIELILSLAGIVVTGNYIEFEANTTDNEEEN